MLTPDDFKKPTDHAWGMLKEYNYAYEKEDILTYILTDCIKMNDWMIVELKIDHSDMVNDGLLYHHSGKDYSLTEMAKGLLYSVYHK